MVMFQDIFVHDKFLPYQTSKSCLNRVKSFFVIVCLLSDTDDCDPYPCVNNATCIDGVCVCSPGFEGRNCTISEFCFSFMSVFMKESLWVKFVVGSFICSERFFSGYSGFPLSSKTNISKFQFDRESGRRRTTMWMCYLQIVIYLFIYLIFRMFVFCFFVCLFVFLAVGSSILDNT